MLQIDPPNIFRGAGNDYNVKVMKCKRITSVANELVRGIAAIITQETGFNPLDRIKFRGRKYVESRQILAYFLYQCTNWTLKEIGFWSGSKDHATILHCKKTVEDLCDSDRRFKEMLLRIEKQVKQLL